MNPIYTLLIISIGALPEEGSLKNVVKTVDWEYVASTEPVDGEKPLDAIAHGSASGTTHLPSPSPISFTDYDSLTEAQVKGWIMSSLTPAQIEELKTKSRGALEQSLKPAVVPMRAPWTDTTPVGDPA